MPFSKETAATHGSKGGGNRWKGKDPETNRNRSFLIKVTQTEYEEIKKKATTYELSNAELVIRAVKAYKEKK